MKYHVSPKTGRPNICKAEKQACPVGGEHFDSKEAALEAIEADAKDMYATVHAPLKKAPDEAESTDAEWATLSGEDKAIFRELIEERKAENAELAQLSLVYRSQMDARIGRPEELMKKANSAMQSNAVSFNPGCSGCQPPHNDYCRCLTYTGDIKDASPQELGEELFHDFAKAEFWRKKTEEEKQAEITVINSLAELVQKYNLHRGENYAMSSGGGYYGEEIRHFGLNENGKLNATRFAQAVDKILAA